MVPLMAPRWASMFGS